MTKLEFGTPYNVNCGDLYRIESRTANVQGRRKLVGPVTKTTESAASKCCENRAKYQIRFSNGLYLAVCKNHRRLYEGEQ